MRNLWLLVASLLAPTSSASYSVGEKAPSDETTTSKHLRGLSEQQQAFKRAVYGDAYVGCYHDSTDYPAMEHHSVVLVEINSCLLYCKSQDFEYAGLKDKDDCFCGNGHDYSMYGQAASDLECDTADCHAYEKCVGPGHLAVYETGRLRAIERRAWLSDLWTGGSSNSSTIEKDDGKKDDKGNSGKKKGGGFINSVVDQIWGKGENYIGCYVDHPHTPVMSFRSHSNHNIESCRQYCGEEKYPYAGLEGSKWCYCGRLYDVFGAADDDSDCDKTCILGNKGICGGDGRLSVYRSKPDTMAPTTAPTGAPTVTVIDDGASDGYIGCFNDNHTVPAMRHKSDDKHNIASCIAYCLDEQFQYAGLTNSTVCFCGNTYDAYGASAEELDCHMICSDGGGICGGHNKLSVFATSEEYEERMLWEGVEGSGLFDSRKPLIQVEDSIDEVEELGDSMDEI